MTMEIKRIDSYTDDRFSKEVLFEHGAYLVDGEPYELKIINTCEAIVRGKDPAAYSELIEEFRFHAPQVCRFYDDKHRLLAEYPAEALLEIRLDDIQPSQFFVDEDKVEAVSSFVHSGEDIVIQIMSYEDRYISLDGHTRLYLAVQRGYESVRAVVSKVDEAIWIFVHEAERRDIHCPGDLILLPHEEYVARWDRYCDEVFAGLNDDEPERKEEKKMEYAIRQISADDYDAVFELWSASEETRRAMNSVDDSREGFTRYLRRNPDTCFAAFNGEKMTGVILSGHDGRRGIIHHLSIHPDFRRRGIASRLLVKAEEALKAQGITKIFELVFKDNDAANEFWQRQGYTIRTNINYRNKSLNEGVPTGE